MTSKNMAERSRVSNQSPYALVGAKLVDNGYSCIPCRPGSKRPGSMSFGEWYGKNDWQQYCDRLPSEFETRAWSKWPDAGVCMALGLGGVVAVDIDTDDPEMCAALAAVIPPSPVAKRGAKGFTAFYRATPAVKSAAYNVNGERVVDLLAHGKQTVLPPTLHPENGRPYIWVTDDTLEFVTPERLPELPDDIAERIADALDPFGYTPMHAPRPNGDGYGNSIWRDLNSAALSRLEDWVPALDLPKLKPNHKGYLAVAFWRPSNRGRPLHDRNSNLKITRDGIKDFHDGDRGYTPLDLVMAALGCGLDYADQWLRERLGYQEPDLYGLEPWFPKPPANEPEVDAPTMPAPQVATVAAPRASVDPFTPQAAGGLLQVISQWILDNGRRPVREFAILGALSFVSALYGRRFVGPTGAGLNVYMVGVAGPGFGKDHPQKALRTLATDTALDKLIGPGEVTSGSAIEKAVRREPCFIMPWDEIGVVLQSVNGRTASSWAQTIRKVLLELYGLSTGIWTGKEHADPKREAATPIHCPTVSLLGMTTPTTFYKGLTEESLSDGFVARLTVIEALNRPDRHVAPPLIVTPPSLVAALKQVTTDMPKVGGNMSRYAAGDMRPSLHAVPWESEDVEKRWIEIEDWQIAEIEENGASDGVVGRAAEQTIKYATMRALSRDGSRARVTRDDIEWGYAIVQRSLDSISRGIRDHMAGSQFEELCKAVLLALKQSKSGTLPLSVLLRARGVSKAEDRLVRSAIDRLAAVGDIEQPVKKGRGLQVTLMGSGRPKEEAA